ncbi:MAG: glycosyltransferase [Cyclobacteriaceae bacterium]|nr:glycosyltransferase [Cyclobacteriaceae bacterium]
MLALPRWDGPYSSTAFSLAKEFSKRNRVFYIDNPFTLKDFLLGFNSKQIRSRMSALLFRRKFCWKIGGNDKLIAVTPGLTIPTNFLSKGRIYDWLSERNDRIISSTLQKIMSDYAIMDFVFINVFNPFYLREFPSFFRPKIFVYYTVDNIQHSKYIHKHGTRLETEIIERADVVFATSRELTRLRSTAHKKVNYLPNAAEVSLFKVASDFVPQELKEISRPIIIYTGHLDQRLDYNLILALLKQHPDKVFVMVGPVSIDEETLKSLNRFDNLLLLGKKDITELPDYVHAAQCAIIPFRCNTLTRSIYPLKLNEYLATGVPVVSTAFSEDVLDFSDVIDIAANLEEFSAKIDASIADNSTEKRIKRILATEGNTWEARVATFWKTVIEKD